MDGQSIGFMGLECTVTDPTVWLCTYDYAPHCDGLRLPTEIEWEVAAVGAPPYLGRPPDELNLDEIAWYGGSHLEGSHPVAQKACNGFGLYDVIGNMSEWAHQPVARGGQPSRATHVPGALNLPSVGTVVRGGDFEDTLDPPDSPNRLRLASRVKYMVGARSAFIGVRLVRTVGRPEGCRLNSECEAGEVCRWDADCLSATGRACLADDQCGHTRDCVEGFCT